jgi:hypothetical protein
MSTPFFWVKMAKNWFFQKGMIINIIFFYSFLQIANVKKKLKKIIKNI